MTENTSLRLNHSSHPDDDDNVEGNVQASSRIALNCSFKFIKARWMSQQKLLNININSDN